MRMELGLLDIRQTRPEIYIFVMPAASDRCVARVAKARSRASSTRYGETRDLPRLVERARRCLALRKSIGRGPGFRSAPPGLPV